MLGEAAHCQVRSAGPSPPPAPPSLLSSIPHRPPGTEWEGEESGLHGLTGPGQTCAQGPAEEMPMGTQVVADSDQPDRRAWAPSLGSPRVAGGQSPGPADWPAPRTALGPQTGRQRQRRKAVSDRKHSTGGYGADGPLTGSSTSSPDTLAHAPTPPTSLAPHLRHQPQANHLPDGTSPLATGLCLLLLHHKLPGPHHPPEKPRQRPRLDRATVGASTGSVSLAALYGRPPSVTTAHQPAPGNEDRAEPATLLRSPVMTVGPQHRWRLFQLKIPPQPLRDHHAGVWAQLRNGPVTGTAQRREHGGPRVLEAQPHC